ncbi:hypothetical protein ACFLZN_01595 [Nanoarchaeota archaeon]
MADKQESLENRLDLFIEGVCTQIGEEAAEKINDISEVKVLNDVMKVVDVYGEVGDKREEARYIGRIMKHYWDSLVKIYEVAVLSREMNNTVLRVIEEIAELKAPLLAELELLNPNSIYDKDGEKNRLAKLREIEENDELAKLRKIRRQEMEGHDELFYTARNLWDNWETFHEKYGVALSKYKSSDEKQDGEIFHLTKLLIEGIEGHINYFGRGEMHTLFGHGIDEVYNPLERLGWIGFMVYAETEEGPPTHYTEDATQQGIALFDRLRSIRGQERYVKEFWKNWGKTFLPEEIHIYIEVFSKLHTPFIDSFAQTFNSPVLVLPEQKKREEK